MISDCARVFYAKQTTVGLSILYLLLTVKMIPADFVITQWVFLVQLSFKYCLRICLNFPIFSLQESDASNKAISSLKKRSQYQ